MKDIVESLHLISKKDPKIRKLADSFNSKTNSVWERLNQQMNKKGCKVRRQVGRPEEVNVSTQISPPTDEIGKRNGDLRNKLPVEPSNKRKTVPPLEVGRLTGRKDNSYAGVCKEREKGDGEGRDKESNDSGDEWIVQTSRRERRRERKGVSTREGGHRLTKAGEKS